MSNTALTPENQDSMPDADRAIMEKILNFTFDWIVFKFVGIQNRYKIWDEFEFRPDLINFGVTRPWALEKKCFGHDCPFSSDLIFVSLAGYEG